MPSNSIPVIIVFLFLSVLPSSSDIINYQFIHRYYINTWAQEINVYIVCVYIKRECRTLFMAKLGFQNFEPLSIDILRGIVQICFTYIMYAYSFVTLQCRFTKEKDDFWFWSALEFLSSRLYPVFHWQWNKGTFKKVYLNESSQNVNWERL